jgi:hypothetical protein
MNLNVVIYLVANFHHFVKKGPNDMVKGFFNFILNTKLLPYFRGESYEIANKW